MLSDAIKVLVPILAGAGVFVVLFKFTSDKKGNIMKVIHDLFQKKGQENIKAIEENQSKIKIEVEKKEKLAEESKEKIKEIQKKAAEEIEEVLKKDRINEIHKEIDDDWESL